MFVTNPIGIIGEEEATRILEKKGLKVVEHNWRMGHLEVDIIAANKNEIIFVEVKTRTSMIGGAPEEAVDYMKKQRIVAAANAYKKHMHDSRDIRFDVVGIVLNRDNEAEQINHYEYAFQPPGHFVHRNSFTPTWHWHHRRR
jgi:putative endonuclease